MPVSRRKTKSVITATGMQIENCYCRYCTETKPVVEFFDSTDPLDKNGKMSVCKTCINSMYQKIILHEISMERTLLKICRLLNFRYDEQAIEVTKNTIETAKQRGKETTSIFGIYKLKVVSVQKAKLDKKSHKEDLTFSEPGRQVMDNLPHEPIENPEYFESYWGKNLQKEDYEFLEIELGEWKKTHKCDTKAEETLLKEICYKQLEIRNKRLDGESVTSLVKDLQDLMKTANVDPSKVAMANSGKSQDTFSSFVKTIEENEPADYYKDKGLFKDFDNIEWYFRKFVTRPLKNFVTGSRDFNIEADNNEDEEEVFDEGESNSEIS